LLKSIPTDDLFEVLAEVGEYDIARMTTVKVVTANLRCARRMYVFCILITIMEILESDENIN
jgi:hypothetical protein